MSVISGAVATRTLSAASGPWHITGDITVGNGAASNLIDQGSGQFTADITPVGDGPVTVDINTAVVQDLEANHALMLSLAGQNTQIQEELQTLQSSREVRAEIEATRADMKDRLGSIENQMQSLAQRNFSLKDDLTSMESDLQSALNERNTALLESTQMRRDIMMLEQKLVIC